MYGEQVAFDSGVEGITDIKEIRRWMNWVKTQVRVGIELEKGGSITGYTPDGSSRLQQFRFDLAESGSYERLSRFNVVRLTHDGSVRGGITDSGGHEVLVTGTIEDFATAHRKMVALHDLIAKYKLKVDQTCGMHYHLVAGQDDLMPGVILKNLYQLMRRYYAAILYMTSTTGAAATPARTYRRRWRAEVSAHISRHGSDDLKTHFYRAAHLSQSPLGVVGMDSIKHAIASRVTRYCAFNMGVINEGTAKNLMQFDDAGNVTRFHVEFRFPDGSDSPAQVVSQMFFFRALLMKAVELSQFGVLKADSDREKWNQNKQAVVLLQGDSLNVSLAGAEPGDARIETFEQAVAFAKQDAKNLLTSLRSHLMNIDGASLNVLQAIVEKPVWKRRAERMTWKRIEQSLMPAERVVEGLQQDILRLISLNQLTGVPNIANWKYAASQALGVTQAEIVNAFRTLEKNVRLNFDRELGSYIVLW